MLHFDQAWMLERVLVESGLRSVVSEENVELMQDFQQRLGVLQALNYTDADRTVQLKGRVAAEASTCDALLVTELGMAVMSFDMSCMRAAVKVTWVFFLSRL